MSAPKSAYTLKLHYHIRWSTSPLLDWQAFESRREAEVVAKELVREDETYTIETAAEGCKRCSRALEESLKRHAVYNNSRKTRLA